MGTANEGFQLRPGKLPQLVVPAWQAWPWLVHGFSTRQGGTSTDEFSSLNLGNHVGDNPEAVAHNRSSWLAELDATTYGEVYMQQVHGNRVVAVERAGPVSSADGVVTNKPGLVLHVMVADCLPILLVDPETKSIGAVHAGWRGTVQDIAGQAVDTMRRHFGTNPANLRAALGPGIGGCCYRVDAPVIDAVKRLDIEWQRVIQDDSSEGQWMLDLPRLNALLLSKAGLEHRHISMSNFCTMDRADLFYSYRRDKGVTGRLVGSIAIRRNADDN